MAENRELEIIPVTASAIAEKIVRGISSMMYLTLQSIIHWERCFDHFRQSLEVAEGRENNSRAADNNFMSRRFMDNMRSPSLHRVEQIAISPFSGMMGIHGI